MPVYCYECQHCNFGFEEIRSIHEKSGKSQCPKCGNLAFKVPALFNAKIFKPRKFADGTETPSFVNTPKQEKAWMKAEGITYDNPTGRERGRLREEKKKQRKTAMEYAFKEAVDKCEQGFRIEKPEEKRKPEKLSFNA